jgi:hypothetical protein
MVRIPHPEKKQGASNDSTVLRVCDAEAMPEKRHCPAFELRTRHWRLSPSSAKTNRESSSDQNASSNLLRSSSAWMRSAVVPLCHGSRDPRPRPRFEILPRTHMLAPHRAQWALWRASRRHERPNHGSLSILAAKVRFLFGAHIQQIHPDRYRQRNRPS